MGLNREQRRKLLAQEIDGEDTEVTQVDVQDEPKAVAPEPVAVSAGVDPAMIAQIVAATVAAMQQSGTVNVADAVGQAIRDNRKPIPENTDAEYHARSHWHPAGKDAPRPALVRRTYRGKWDHEERKAVPTFEYEASQLRDDEIETINALTPGQYTVKRSDGVETVMHVVDQEDSMGHPFRRILAFPAQLSQKEYRNVAPTLEQIREQLRLTVA